MIYDNSKLLTALDVFPVMSAISAMSLEANAIQHLWFRTDNTRTTSSFEKQPVLYTLGQHGARRQWDGKL